MPTITVRQFDYEELRRRLDPGDRILILSCNACARQSDGLGGKEGLNLDNSRASCLKPFLTARKPCKATACILKRDV